jgi:phospholipase/carboxylesterase
MVGYEMGSGDSAVAIDPPGQATAAVILLHGLGADGHDLAALAGELDPSGGDAVRFVFPHAPFRPVTINEGMSMRSWYDIRAADLSRSEDEEGIEASAVSLQHMVHRQIAAGIPPRRVVIGGFSQGGAVALYAGLSLAGRLGGILAMSAYLPLYSRFQRGGAAADSDTAVMMTHGTDDPIVPVTYGQLSRRRLETLGYTVRWREYPMGHTICEQEILDVASWLGEVLD